MIYPYDVDDYGPHSRYGKLDSLSWDEIKSIADKISASGSEEAGIEIAIEHGLIRPDGILRGDECKRIVISKTRCWDEIPCEVRIWGFFHDDKVVGGKAGITFGFKNVPLHGSMNYLRKCSGPRSYEGKSGLTLESANSGGWEVSAMRGFLNEGLGKALFFEEKDQGIHFEHRLKFRLPYDLDKKVVFVKKKTNNNGTPNCASARDVTVTYDRIWLPSLVEMYGNAFTSVIRECWWGGAADVYAAEGKQYKLCAEQSGYNSLHGCYSRFDVKSDSEGPTCWWTRSSAMDRGDGRFHYVGKRGGAGGTTSGACRFGISPCFCL